MTIISDDLEELHLEITLLKAERAAWEVARDFADAKPLTEGMVHHRGFMFALTEEIREQILERIDDEISYCQHDIVRVSKSEGSA